MDIWELAEAYLAYWNEHQDLVGKIQEIEIKEPEQHHVFMIYQVDTLLVFHTLFLDGKGKLNEWVAILDTSKPSLADQVRCNYLSTLNMSDMFGIFLDLTALQEVCGKREGLETTLEYMKMQFGLQCFRLKKAGKESLLISAFQEANLHDSMAELAPCFR